MIPEIPIQFERGIRQEDLKITKIDLFNDNHSEEAGKAREIWNEKRKEGKLRGFARCSDARLKTVGESISVGSVAAVANPIPSVVSDRSLESLTALSHIDGDEIIPGKMPTGCGGHEAKERIGDTPQQEGIGRWISGMASKDPAIQAIVTAEKLAYASDGKPVLAAIQDHLNYTIYPVAFFQLDKGQMRSISSVRNEDILKHNPKRIYENGIPTIDEGHLPDVLAEMLEDNRREAQSILAKYPDLKRLQKVLRPRMILFSTDIRSVRVKYPKTSLPPGSVFKVHIPTEKISDGYRRIDESALTDSLNQLEYPIDHAVKNHEDTTLPFSNTDRVIIETGDFDLSISLAKEALKKPWMKKWLRLNDRRILVVQTNSGVVNVIDEFSP